MMCTSVEQGGIRWWGADTSLARCERVRFADWQYCAERSVQWSAMYSVQPVSPEKCGAQIVRMSFSLALTCFSTSSM